MPLAILAFIFGTVGLMFGCTAGASQDTGDHSYKGCSDQLPPGAFSDCINRQGQYAGIPDTNQ